MRGVSPEKSIIPLRITMGWPKRGLTQEDIPVVMLVGFRVSL